MPSSLRTPQLETSHVTPIYQPQKNPISTYLNLPTSAACTDSKESTLCFSGHSSSPSSSSSISRETGAFFFQAIALKARRYLPSSSLKEGIGCCCLGRSPSCSPSLPYFIFPGLVLSKSCATPLFSKDTHYLEDLVRSLCPPRVMA